MLSLQSTHEDETRADRALSLSEFFSEPHRAAILALSFASAALSNFWDPLNAAA